MLRLMHGHKNLASHYAGGRHNISSNNKTTGVAFTKTKKNDNSSDNDEEAVCFGYGGNHTLQLCKTIRKATKSKIWKEINAGTRDWGYSPENAETKYAVVNMDSFPAVPSSTATGSLSTGTGPDNPHSYQHYTGYLDWRAKMVAHLNINHYLGVGIHEGVIMLQQKKS